jgi:flagellin-specific chaperone FliS
MNNGNNKRIKMPANQSYNRVTNPYLAQKVMSASPEQLIAYVYDTAIAACARQDRSKALSAIHILINSLRFDDKKVAFTFYNVYKSILDRIYKKRLTKPKTCFLTFAVPGIRP